MKESQGLAHLASRLSLTISRDRAHHTPGEGRHSALLWRSRVVVAEQMQNSVGKEEPHLEKELATSTLCLTCRGVEGDDDVTQDDAGAAGGESMRPLCFPFVDTDESTSVGLSWRGAQNQSLE